MKTVRLPSGLVSIAITLTSTLLGVLAFIYPFFNLGGSSPEGSIRSAEMPWLVSMVVGLCVLVLIFEIQGQGVDTRSIALLGVLVAINAALRFIEVAIPGPGGFSPIFFLILLVGYVFGGRFGFLLGAFTLLVSAFITGGVGPWLPGQMLTAGWVGMSAPLCRPMAYWTARLIRRPLIQLEVAFLVLAGAGWGLLYGAVMNLWAWPFLTGPAAQYWTPGLDLSDTLDRYLMYYLVTSLAWDLARSAGNVLLISLFGAPTLKALRRFHGRFMFDYIPEHLSPRPELSIQRSPELASQCSPKYDAPELHGGPI